MPSFAVELIRCVNLLCDSDVSMVLILGWFPGTAMASCAVHLTVAGYHDDVGMATRSAVVWEFSGQVVCVMTLLSCWNLVL